MAPPHPPGPALTCCVAPTPGPSRHAWGPGASPTPADRPFPSSGSNHGTPLGPGPPPRVATAAHLSPPPPRDTEGDPGPSPKMAVTWPHRHCGMPSRGQPDPKWSGFPLCRCLCVAELQPDFRKVLETDALGFGKRAGMPLRLCGGRLGLHLLSRLCGRVQRGVVCLSPGADAWVGPSILAGRAPLPLGAPDGWGTPPLGAGQTPGQWAPGEGGAPGTGHQQSRPAPESLGGCLAPLLVG